MLVQILDDVTSQLTEPSFTFEVVVVDNDCKRSAEGTVCLFQPNKALKIIYDCEPEQNISLARNRAIRNATGNFVAFIDDDEFPVKDWLKRLYHTIKAYDADGVLGPVLPFFPPGAPQWLKKGNIFDRRRLRTGSRLTSRDTRTGNVLLVRSTLHKEEICFDPAFGLTGGEDVNFFENQIRSGCKYVWCDEAKVYETVPPERWLISFHLKKYFRIGTLNGERLRKSNLSGFIALLKSTIALPARIFLLVVSLPLGKHVWIRPALKITYYSGCFLAYCGFSLLRYRD